MREMNPNGAVKQAVAQTPAAIGYVGLGYVDSTVKAVSVISGGQAVAPTLENVLSNKYPISRPLYMITKGEPSGLAKDYLDFILSPDGQKLVQDEGFVPVS
jgi:phosphate transport system substrate-binding protein